MCELGWEAFHTGTTVSTVTHRGLHSMATSILHLLGSDPSVSMATRIELFIPLLFKGV
uniref:Uncharacterized protein n=1 Tax=Anguilla anguilla TaxID=7936 RepID=A0A0E9QTB8_ANGAN